MRGRLINPFLAKVARLDTVATAALPGYDKIFREPIKGTDGKSKRVEHTPELLPCQVEVGAFEALHQVASGNDPDSSITIVFHFEDLEELGLVDPATGNALITVGARLISIHRYDDEALVTTCGKDGYFCIEAQPQSFGLAGGDRNLLVTKFDCRDASPKNSGVGS